MIFVHSFQLDPQQKFEDLEKKLKIILVNYAYSVECIHRFGHSIELYTDILGSEILKALPYDKVHIVDNDITKSHCFITDIKFRALQNMTLDQILIDGHTFLEKSVVFNIIDKLNTDIVISSLEPKDILKSGLLKFNNEDLKQKYIQYYINYIKQAENTLPDSVFEQFNIEKLFENTKYELGMVNPYHDIDTMYAYKIGFCHLDMNKEELQNYYIRLLQTLNYSLVLDLEEYYLYLINDFCPKNLNII